MGFTATRQMRIFARIPPSLFIVLAFFSHVYMSYFLYNLVLETDSLRIRVPFMRARKAGAPSLLLPWAAVALHRSKLVCYMRGGLPAIREPGLKSSGGWDLRPLLS